MKIKVTQDEIMTAIGAYVCAKKNIEPPVKVRVIVHQHSDGSVTAEAEVEK